MPTQNLPALCVAAAVAAMLPFMVASLKSYRRTQLLLTKHRRFYQGRPRKQRFSRWVLPDFITYGIRRLRPKLQRNRMAAPLIFLFIQNLFA